MDSIQALFHIDFPYVFLSVFLILTGIKTILSLLEWMTEKLGFETKWMRRKKEERRKGEREERERKEGRKERTGK